MLKFIELSIWTLFNQWNWAENDMLLCINNTNAN